MIKIICFGKIKEQYLNELIADYLKRINKYHKIYIIELKDYDDLVKEKDLIFKQIKKDDYNIALCIEGQPLSSQTLATKIADIFNYHANINFIIGSSTGLHNDIKEIADSSLSFSLLTFPHGLFRGILLEQIYRSCKINNNETYHK